MGYFQSDPERLKAKGLFRVAVDLAFVYELEVNIAMNNYSHIATIEDPNIVSNYFKILLREMSDPVCPYHLYDRFLSLTSVDREKRVTPLKGLVRLLPKINFNTLKYIVSFCKTVIA